MKRNKEKTIKKKKELKGVENGRNKESSGRRNENEGKKGIK